MDKATIIAERMRRQRLSDPLNDQKKYKELFKLLQPVSPAFFSYPGSPPKLVHRTTFDDGNVTDGMRAERIIVKGRFLGGTIGYVLAEDLNIYANAFCRPLPLMNEIQQTVFDAIRRSENLTPRQIKEETGLLIKQIAPALHRLQEAFLVYEDQVDSDWERNWYELSVELPEVKIENDKWKENAIKVLSNFFQGQVFATLEQLRDWSQFSIKSLKDALQDMETDGVIASKTIEGLGEGFVLMSDLSLIKMGIAHPTNINEVSPSVFMLHKSDILARSYVSELKRRFGDYEVLQYLLIDGVFQGAVIGHWRIGPHDVDDIIVELSTSERINRRKEIIDAVSWQYKSPFSRILRYAGEEI